MKLSQTIRDLETEHKALSGRIQAVGKALDGLRVLQGLNGKTAKTGSTTGIPRTMMECVKCGLKSDWPATRAQHSKSKHDYTGDNASGEWWMD